MKRIGIISYNIYGNFTNYGSALQSWALSKTIEKLNIQPILVDYCPNFLLDADILNPLEKMWDQDKVSIENTRRTLPAIKENYYKFESFFNTQFKKTNKKYTAKNFDEIINDEHLDGFVCGSDTVFCIDESHGFDDGFFANFPCMKNNSISYGASFGDTNITSEQYLTLKERLKNFKAIGLRENRMLSYCKQNTNIPVCKTIDPTLLLTSEEYDNITAPRIFSDKYLLLYTRRYNEQMEKYAEYLAQKHNFKIVEISLRATNTTKGHIMMYQAGVEEFLSLIKNAEYVVTNSFHGLLLSVILRKQFSVFLRETGNNKITEVLELFGLKNNLLTSFEEKEVSIDNYDFVHQRINVARKNSITFLEKELNLL